MKVVKRNGSEVLFDITKIIIAVTRANESVAESDRMTPVQIQRIAQSVELQCQQLDRSPTVEKIQDLVEHQIMAHGAFEVAKSYITYRYTRSLVRKSNTTDDKILSLIEFSGKDRGDEAPGRNPVAVSAQRDYIAGVVSRDITNRLLLPREIAEAHNEGLLHFHDADHFVQRMHRSTLVDLAGMLQSGAVLSGTLIERPRSFGTACTVATQLLSGVAREQYGPQTVSLAHLAPFVELSRQRLREAVRGELDGAGLYADDDKVDAIAEKRLRAEIRRGIQTLQYQLSTLLELYAPLRIVMYLGEAAPGRERADLALLIEEMLLQRLRGVKDASGSWVTPTEPRLLYVLEQDNIRPDGPSLGLTELAARCAARRGDPLFLSEKQLRELRGGNYCPAMAADASLPPFEDGEGEPKYYGRFDQGLVTLNLADVALSAKGSFDRFWKLLEERLELCRRALLCRHQRLKGTLSDAAPLLWQQGACARLRPGEAIDKLLYGGRSTLSLGYAGLRECVRAMTGKTHAESSAAPFALEVVNALSDACRRWSAQHNIAFVLCGDRMGGAGERLAACLRRRFGQVPGVTDGARLTDSFHMGRDDADPRDLVAAEAPFQRLSPGSVDTRVTIPEDPAAALELLRFLYDHTLCASPASDH